MTNQEQRIERRGRSAKRPIWGARANGRTRRPVSAGEVPVSAGEVPVSAGEVEVRRARQHVFLDKSDSRALA